MDNELMESARELEASLRAKDCPNDASTIAALVGEVKQLQHESAAFAANLRGKHAVTGATYAALLAEVKRLKERLRALAEAAPVAEIHPSVTNGRNASRSFAALLDAGRDLPVGTPLIRRPEAP